VRDRATFLAGIRKPADADLIGTWSSVRGSVEIMAADAGKFEISADIVTNPVSGSGACDVGGTVEKRKTLRLVDTDDNGSPTGFAFRRDGDALVVDQDGTGKDDRSEPPSCGANGHADGTFFLSEKQ
jgi:hypothetical protein